MNRRFTNGAYVLKCVGSHFGRQKSFEEIKDIRMLTRVGAAMGYYQLFKIRKPLSVQILITNFAIWHVTCLISYW